jgi:hypothetical protein
MPAIHYLNILAIGTAFNMAALSIQETMVASGRTRAYVETNLVRLIWLVAGCALALVRQDSMVLVLTIGLIEIPAYLYGLWRMGRLHLIRWRREFSLLLTIGLGAAAGGALSYTGRIFLPNV